MAKLDKSKYTKQQWRKIKEQKRLEKNIKRSEQNIIDPKTIEKIEPEIVTPSGISNNFENTAFVLGNGVSRRDIHPEDLRQYGKIYGCNALYREFNPDYLVAVDTKMILEINKAGYQRSNQVWTNPNKSFTRMQGFNYFQPSKGWSSGPTALWLASQHKYKKIYILGFDYRGLEDGAKFNNVYADTPNYKKSIDGATFFGNWMRQTRSVVAENINIEYVRVISKDGYIPKDLSNLSNLTHIYVEDFIKIL